LGFLPSIHEFLVAFCDLCNNNVPIRTAKKNPIIAKKTIIITNTFFFDVHLFSPGANVVLLSISLDLPLSKELPILNHQTAN
jgi:hypothetical protein